MYRDGEDLPQDDAEAARWYRLAAEQGHAEAQGNLGVMYASGRGVSQDYGEALRWFRLAADQGHAPAQRNLGVAYANGLGVQQDARKATQWFCLAAHQAHLKAQVNCGHAYLNGSGVDRDAVQAQRWFRLAADEGDAVAQHNLGFIYATGNGVPQDATEALRWFRLAAAQGLAAAQHSLGFVYETGEGVPQNNAEAVRWYRLAADQGHASAQHNLAFMLARGRGVEKEELLLFFFRHSTTSLVVFKQWANERFRTSAEWRPVDVFACDCPVQHVPEQFQVWLRGPTTKNRRTRLVPIGTKRLLAVLEWLRLDVEGRQKPDDAPVFSNEVGELVRSFRSAWLTTVLKAHGVKPHWRKKASYRQLTEDYVEAFQAINLHWHDLRHEYASRLVERGVPLSQVRDLLGHASITTTERYDNQRLEALQAAAGTLESGKGFDQDESSGRTDFQESFKNDPQEASSDPAPTLADSGANGKGGEDLEEWLGGRDSNPDYTVQSRVSYH